MVRLVRLLRQDLIVPEIATGTKADLLAELVRVMDLSGNVTDRETLLSDMLEREEVTSTAVGRGVAVPHCRTGSVTGIIVVLARVPKGIDFSAPDGGLVNLVFAVAAPEKAREEYLSLLGMIACLGDQKSFRAEVLAAADAPEIMSIIRRYEERELRAQRRFLDDGSGEESGDSSWS